MLEHGINQAAGLQGMALQMSPKLVAFASHGNQQGELPLLWSLCTTWVDMGLPVVVLDGHASESDQNPGLVHLMTDPMGHVPEDQDTVAWSVLPAAVGLADLAGIGFNPDALGDCFRKFALVVLYANANVLSMLLKDRDLSPLLVVTPLKVSSLTAYQAMKQLLLEAGLHPTVANIAVGSSKTAGMTEPIQNLQDCAMSFLGLTVKPITVSAANTGEASHHEITRLALQLLENAVFLERHPIPRTH